MLEIQNISKTYSNGVLALDAVSLNIPCGIFGLLGPNGAGKSTLMRSLATLQMVDSGSIHFGETDVLKDPAALRAQLGYLPQDFGVYPRMSARALLSHLALLKGIANRKERAWLVDKLLDQTGLSQSASKAVANFSGGMRRRFGIAQALIGDPQLLIVDEPTAGLDPTERNRFHNLLSEICEHVVVLLSTHIVEDIADLCSEMAILFAGRITRQGTPTGLISMLDGKVWSKTISKQEREAYEADYQVVSARISAGRLRIRVLSDASPGEGFEPTSATLEDVYFVTLSEASAQLAPA